MPTSNTSRKSLSMRGPGKFAHANQFLDTKSYEVSSTYTLPVSFIAILNLVSDQCDGALWLMIHHR
jgi:hypothetical protein